MVQSVERALNILEELSCVGKRSEGIGVVRLSKTLGLKCPTTHNILKTLLKQKYVEKIAQTSKYRIGKNCYSLVGPKTIIDKLRVVSKIPIQHLAEHIREFVTLVVYHQKERIVICSIETQHLLKINTDIFVDYNAYKTATGRILLSQLNDMELRSYVKRHGIPGKVWDGINSFRSLKRKAAEIKEMGIAFYQCEDRQISAAAVPVFQESSMPKSSLGIYLPSIRFNGKRRKEIINGLKNTAKEIRANFIGANFSWNK